jgi:alpha-galactosidase
MNRRVGFIAAAALLLAHAAVGQETGKKVKVFILAGQSNMEGHAKVETFDYIGDDPATAPLLKRMRNADGTPKVCDNVWISYLTGPADCSANGEGLGKLTAGYGARGGSPAKDGGKIGPEFTFGLRMDEELDQPVVLIKVAWGGKSLHTDFRPPSAGPYELNDFQKKFYYGPPAHGRPANMDEWLAEKKKSTGLCYRLMIEHVQKVLKDIKRVYPDYQEGQGYELAGFVWFQGWNDMVDSHHYPNQGKPGRFDEYSSLLSQFIRDVRKDLSAPEMPFVIGVMGVGGEIDPAKPNADMADFRRAMAAPAEMPEFKGTVAAVQTAPFWDVRLGEIDANRGKISQMNWMIGAKDKNGPNVDGKMTPEQHKEYMKEYSAKLVTPEDEALWKRGASNAGYHYLGCAKTFALMGEAFADTALSMQKK